MSQTQRDQTFYAAISDEARLPATDTHALVSDFLNAISGFVSDDAWEVLMELSPADVKVERQVMTQAEGTIEDFLLEMSDVESVEAGRAAEHARVVAEALRSRADRKHLEALKAAIADDEVLALFELSRGELTETDTPTAGQQAQSGD